jgi:hypothetical protein
MITRLRLDAALYEPVPMRKAGKAGRSRKKGERLPTLEQQANSPATQWKTCVFSQWYGQKQKCM